MEALVEFNYEAQELDELTIRKGDIIKDVKVSNGGWWEGTLRDKRGLFPDNFVKVLETQGTSTKNSIGSEKSATMKNDAAGEVTLRNGSGRKLCRVLFSYDPVNNDELKLVPDESIVYLGEVEEGWWRGELNGVIGVFPSNFVSTPEIVDETDKTREKVEYCRVLYPYSAANVDELTITEGDVITLLSKDSSDKGWWTGKLKNKVGLFPDNFVEIITTKNKEHTDGTTNQTSASIKSNAKNHAGKKKETANVRKSLEAKNLSLSSTSTLSGNAIDKKSSNPLMSSIKRLVSDSNNVSNNNGNVGTTGLNEDLDEVERGEGGLLSHLTASRAKAPRRRLPSAQHLKHNVTTPPAVSPGSDNISIKYLKQQEENMTNGNAEILETAIKDDESDGLLSKLKKVPWVEELKLNQIERKKGNMEKSDKGEPKKDRVFSWLTSPENNIEASIKQKDLDGEDKQIKKEIEKEKPRKTERNTLTESSGSVPESNMPAYIPYHLYAPLLDRIAGLEEKQTILQRKVNQLSEQLASYVGTTTNDRD